MIVYKELSSLAADLGFSGKSLYSLSNHIDRHYRMAEIPKPNGEPRRIWIPDPFLKAVQRSILRTLLVWEDISPYATAYRFGGSPQVNARPHVGQPEVLKLDIRKFFDHLYYPLVKKYAFPAERYSEANRVLLSLLCVYRDALPQGAPTSPAISNMILKDMDNRLGAWCRERQIRYTRYCDDLTFSGALDARQVKAKVQEELKPLGLFLNGRKTVLQRQGQRMKVTGLVVNEKLAVPSSYRRALRQELYYCQKYGLEEQWKRRYPSEPDAAAAEVVDRTKPNVSAAEMVDRTEPKAETVAAYGESLLGRVRYVLSVEPENREMQAYAAWLEEQCRRRREAP